MTQVNKLMKINMTLFQHVGLGEKQKMALQSEGNLQRISLKPIYYFL